jgi:hypothetical protein
VNEVQQMNKFRSLRADIVGSAFPVLLILAGFALMLMSSLGVLSADSITRFWPLAIVAAGLVELDPTRKEQQ